MSFQKKPHSKKTKILFHSCHSRQLSGFGKNCKNVLKYLCSTGKYEVIEVANAFSLNDKSLKNLPWKCLGSGPDDEKEIIENNENEITAREMSYGLLKIDEIIKTEKPDIYIGSEDIWAFIKTLKKPWWNKIPCIIWTTLDSLPLLPEALSMAPKIKHFYTWASFAKKAMHKEGFTHVDSLNGSIETSQFFKLNNQEKYNLRKELGIQENAFVVGFVFRNQTRKSVPNLIQGFTKFSENKDRPCYLLLHTGWHEGWDIISLAKESGLDHKKILTTYFCKNCNKYSIQSFEGQSCTCKICKSKSMNTISVQSGPSEKQLNEIYNLMDVYCHPFTSGGQEIPIQEAKLTELITLVTNYSCGEDMCVEEAASISLDWSEFREPGTQFIKASTKPSSIEKALNEVYLMPEELKEKLGKKARSFILQNYSVDAVGRKLEKKLSKIKLNKYDFKFKTEEINPDYEPPRITDDGQWIVDIYKNMFNKVLSKKSPILETWLEKLNNGTSRESILSALKNIAKKEKSVEYSFEQRKKEILNSGTALEERIGVSCKGGKLEVFYSMTALEEIQKLHPHKKIFFITHPANFTIINSANHIYKKISYFKEIEKEDFQKKEGGLFSTFYNFSNIKQACSNNNLNNNLLE